MYNLFTKEFIKLIIICFLSVFVFSCKEDTNTEKEIDLSKISYQINGLSSYSSENEIVTKLNDYEEINVPGADSGYAVLPGRARHGGRGRYLLY